jgi:rubrerythrin
MAYDFSADDIFSLAEEIERNGAAFYRDAARIVSAAAQKELLLHLADMEDGHEKMFKTMRAELTEKERAGTVFDPDDESALYLKALADMRVFFDKPIDTSSMENILKAALTAEKDSIVLYLGMKDLVPEKSGKDRIDSIIKEEMGHIRLLGKELTAMQQ